MEAGNNIGSVFTTPLVVVITSVHMPCPRLKPVLFAALERNNAIYATRLELAQTPMAAMLGSPVT
jgi:hypothetical protein